MKTSLALTRRLAGLLISQGQKLVTAESCTGGMLASLMTENAGSSKFFDCGVVTYSNASKIALLGVPSSVLEAHGAVSLEMARAMAEGALALSGADVSIAITGIAGPDGGSVDKPVGTVCFAWGRRDRKTEVKRVQFPATTRSRIRSLACCEAMEGLIALL